MQCSILDILRDSGDTYVSGEEMAKIAGVSRSAIWKNIQELRARGYEIDSRARNGYRLVSTPDILLPEEISYGLHTDVIGKKIIFLKELILLTYRLNASLQMELQMERLSSLKNKTLEGAD